MHMRLPISGITIIRSAVVNKYSEFIAMLFLLEFVVSMLV